MRTAGIICEYNPFHGGHQHQIAEIRKILGEDTAIVCLMSGNYVQRGEPAIYPKEFRAKAAVLGGADLVLELPLTAAVNAAGYFAAGGVKSLNKLGCVDDLVFGSECGDIRLLTKTAELLSSPEFDDALSREMTSGCSYASAREAALNALGGDGSILSSPNNALGVDYIRELLRQKSKIRPVTIPRDERFPTASEIRQTITPENAESIPHTLSQGERAMLAVLRTLPDQAFEEMPFGSEGLWSKVMKEARRQTSLDKIIMACKSKRYAYSRLRRMLLCLFLGLSQEDLQKEPPYLRVLSFNDRGRSVLRTVAKTASLPLISGAIPNTPEAKAYFALEQRARDLYDLFAPAGCSAPCGQEKGYVPVYIPIAGAEVQKF